MERLATRFPRAHEENTPKVRFVETKWPDWSIDLTKEEFKGLHWHRRDGEWYAGRDLWAVQVSIFNRSWHSQFKLSFFSGANCDFTRVHLRWWSTPAVRTFPFQLQTKCLPGEKNYEPTFLLGIQAGRCSSVFIKAFLFACNPICKSKVPQKWPHKEEEEERT